MILLNSYNFDEAHTAVEEQLEEIGGKDARTFTISGLIVGKSSVEAIQDELDTILDEASKHDAGATLSLRSGREFNVERLQFECGIQPEELVGSFKLKLSAPDPFELASTPTTDVWNVTASGQTRQETGGGNAESLPKISIVASGDVIDPKIDDGTRSMQYSGTVAAGETLVIDAAQRTATLEGEDVLPYMTGDFPLISPEGTTLTYTDDPASSHTATVTVEFKNRWW